MRQSTQEILAQLEHELTQAERMVLLADPNWHSSVPEAGGVYAIWDRGTSTMVYVGETCNLQHRFGDFGRIANHTFRRKVATILRLGTKDEVRLSEHISQKYEITFLPLDFGRKELEEYLLLRWETTVMNKPPVRLKLSQNYKWLIDRLLEERVYD